MSSASKTAGLESSSRFCWTLSVKLKNGSGSMPSYLVSHRLPTNASCSSSSSSCSFEYLRDQKLPPLNALLCSEALTLGLLIETEREGEEVEELAVTHWMLLPPAALQQPPSG
ncbi:hypothetical protein TcWFU_003169 [Taenia crassiceps]|uniref:Uncharacterized protein n=1 Tax=Taenia crassiceps TaxID=6207 RepID=A0ABR4Q1C1_9CEST